MSHQELSSAKYLSETSTLDPDVRTTELQIESSKSTRAAGIKIIYMLLLVAVVAGFNGGAYWLFTHNPRAKESESDVRTSLLNWLVGGDVTESPEPFDVHSLAEMDLRAEIQPMATSTFDGTRMRFSDEYDDNDEDY